MGNEVIQFDTRTMSDPQVGAPLAFRGNKATFYVKCASNGGNLIASGSQDSMVCIWDRSRVQDRMSPTDPFMRLGSHEKLNGHLHEVNEVSWASQTTLLSCSDDASVLVWDLQ